MGPYFLIGDTGVGPYFLIGDPGVGPYFRLGTLVWVPSFDLEPGVDPYFLMGTQCGGIKLPFLVSLSPDSSIPLTGAVMVLLPPEL